jgi:RHS repeat-associated protein
MVRHGNGRHDDRENQFAGMAIRIHPSASLPRPTPGATSTYRYDGLGRRIEKIGNGQTRRYVYDGEDILLEYDGSNVLQARYTHGPGIDEPIAMTRGGANYFYHQDGLGTVTELTDSTGVTAQSYAYDAWGNVLEQTGSIENPYTYTGRELDIETGLSYYRARHYDQRIGRFLQKDPIGFAGGDVNLYTYVGNNPMNRVDPKGEQAEVLILGGGLSLGTAAIIGGAAITSVAIAACYTNPDCRQYISCFIQLLKDYKKCISQQICDPNDQRFDRCINIANQQFGRCKRGYPPREIVP